MNHMHWQEVGIIRVVWGLLWAGNALWDLVTQKMPLILLIIFLAISVIYSSMTGWIGLWMNLMTAILLTVSNIPFVRKKQMGSGDLWIMASLGMALPLPELADTVFYGSLHLFVTGMITAGFYGQRKRIPMAPFLLLGYLMQKGW